MAKKNEELVPVAPAALATTDDAALALLGINPNDQRGKENISNEDVKPTILKIAQKMSDELEESHRNYMPDLKPNMLFITDGSGPGKIVGKQIDVIVIALRKYAVQHPDEKRGIMTLERDVRWNDPRCSFGPNGEKPIATRYYDFAVLIPFEGTLKLVTLRMKTTNIDAAKALNGVLIDRSIVKGPTFAYRFGLTVRPEKRTVEGKEVTFGVFDYLNLKNPAVVTPAEFKVAEKAYAAATEYLKKAGDVIEGDIFEREPGSDDM
jgi:hypothetical protein